MKFYMGVLCCCLQIWFFFGAMVSGAVIQAIPAHWQTTANISPPEKNNHKLTTDTTLKIESQSKQIYDTGGLSVTKIKDKSFTKMAAPTHSISTEDDTILSNSVEASRDNGQSKMTLSDFQDQKEKVTNPHPYSYIINQPGACFGKIIKLLIIVCSAVDHFEQREVIRATWGGHVEHDVKVLFLLGAPKQDSVFSEVHQYQVSREASRYQDIIQEDFGDSYQNLSLKSVAMLRWASKHCSNAQYLLKTDDDMFINIPVLLHDLDTTVHKNFIMGDIIAGAEPIGDRASKWYTPKSMFAQKMYPKYISGTAYVISGDLVYNLYQATLHTKLFWLEDIYITGLCAQKVNAQHIYNGKFGYRKRHLDPCLFKLVITGHKLTPEEIYIMWLAVNNPKLRCRHIRINLGNAE